MKRRVVTTKIISREQPALEPKPRDPPRLVEVIRGMHSQQQLAEMRANGYLPVEVRAFGGMHLVESAEVEARRLRHAMGRVLADLPSGAMSFQEAIDILQRAVG